MVVRFHKEVQRSAFSVQRSGVRSDGVQKCGISYKSFPGQIRCQEQMALWQRLEQLHRPRLDPMFLSISLADQVQPKLIILWPLHADDADLLAQYLGWERKCQLILDHGEQSAMLFGLIIGVHGRLSQRRANLFLVESLSP